MEEVAGIFGERAIERDVAVSTPEFPLERVGIGARQILDEALSSRDLAIAAAHKAFRASRATVDDIRCVIVSTVTTDRVVPAIACSVHADLGLPRSAQAFDLTVGCNGFVSALDIAQRYLATEPLGASVIVIGAETMSRVMDASDRTTCSIFGDGAGAVVLRRTEAPGMTDVRTCTLGDQGDEIQISSDGLNHPLFRFSTHGGEFCVREDHLCKRRVVMAGRRVFRDMLRVVPEFVAGYLDHICACVDEVDAFVFHQANQRMIEGIADSPSLKIPPDKLLSNIVEVGNTTSASIPILLSEAIESGRIGEGSRVLLVGFGTGYSLGTTLLTLPSSHPEALSP